MNAQLSEEERAAVIDGIPCCRAGNPQDIAQAAVFLTSGKADYICGQVLRIDGGWI
jgi:3-oxoacyl-[acyl-carrier protein] reductase